MYIILFFFIYIIIFLIYTRNLKPIDTEIEHFLNNHNESVSLNAGELYKKNTDLQYYDNKSDANISENSKFKTNQVAPIIDTNVGKNSSDKYTVADVPKNLTNRKPDYMSTYSEYVVPLPNFDFPDSRYQKFNIVKKKKNVKTTTTESQDNEKSIVTKNIVDVPSNKNTNPLTSGKCKFISSIIDSTGNEESNYCSEEYPIYTGATFSSLSSSLNCNSDIELIPAEALAIIKEGKVSEIKIIKNGKNYSKNPDVYVRGDGEGCKLKSKVIDGEITEIEVIETGQDYTSTPSVIIEKPDPKINCNLCCKS